MDARGQELPVEAGALTSLPAMALALSANFGSVERWREEFTAMALGAGSGWARLVFQPHAGTLVNQRAADPTQALAGGVPLLVLAAGTCVDAFMQDIRWDHVYARYQQAVEQASDAFAAGQDELGGALLLDVRRSAVYRESATMLPGARWCDPGEVGRWAASLPADRAVVVYCVYGHEVGRATALRLRAAGLDARFLRGGIDAWKAAGKALQLKGGRS